MKIYIPISCFLIFIFSCSSEEKEKKEIVEKYVPKEGECPKNPKDKVIPILYGMPSEESFKQADSGLVILAGCILPENPKFYFCTVHKIEF